MRIVVIAMIAGMAVLAYQPTFADDLPSCSDLLQQKEVTLQSLAAENAILLEKLRQPLPPAVTAPELQSRMTSRLKEIAADVKVQRQSMNDFQGYVTWMSGNIAGYSRYIEAGSVAAGFARVLPIPYAGQAGMFAKFVSHFTLSLSAASKSITSYLASSQQFISRVDALEKNPAGNGRELTELSRFADEQLMKDMLDLQGKLSTTSELSSSTLSFLESLNHYVGSSDEYWAKAKSLVKKGDEKKEKSFLAENISGLKNRAGSFNGRLRSFDDSIRRNTPQIKGLTTYNDLLKELGSRQPVSLISSRETPQAAAQ